MIMKKFLIAALVAIPFMVSAQDKLHFAVQPSLSPDAKTIYFEYDGDIWSVESSGGSAKRITAMQAYESMAIPSPDGKWLAFASNQNGNNDVYILNINGGDIKQLTFNDTNDTPVSWGPDSKSVNISSGRYNSISAYKVSINGGTPVRLFDNYFNTITNLNEMVDGSYLFNESNESHSYATRKGYKGDYNPDIKQYNPKTKEYKELTSYKGKDIWPTSDKNGNIYFATDQKNTEYNIATIKDGKTSILTDFNISIQYPKVSFNGEKIVFNKDYTIGVYDVKTGKVDFPTITLAKQNSPQIANSYNVEGKISSFAVSPDTKKLAFVSRGRLFVSDKEGKAIKELPTNASERVVEVEWCNDNKTVLFTRTRNGWYNLFSMDASVSSPEKAVYTPNKFVKNLVSDHAHNKFAFTTGDDRVDIYDTKTAKVEKLADAEIWTFRGYTLNFSFDDKYLTFEAENLFEKDVYIVDIATKKLTNITSSATFDGNPVWAANNQSLYILADRFNASFPRGNISQKLFQISLDKYDTPFMTERYNSLFSSDKESKESKNANINLNNIHRRWRTVENGGSQVSLSSVLLKDVNYLVYGSSHAGSYASYVYTINEKDQKPSKKIDGINRIGSISVGSDGIYTLSGGAIYSLNLRDGKATKINIAFPFSQTNSNEFSQMLNEVWAQLESNFYDVKHHGVDWNAKLKYYSSLAPYVQNRKNLRILINDMLGELNSSHLGFSGGGLEEKTATRLFTQETGILFDNNSPYIVDYVLEGTPADRIGVNVKKGDELVAVNGINVDKNKNRYVYFTSPVIKKEVTLKFKRGADFFDVNVHTMSVSALKEQLYNKWEDDCRAIVDQKTGNRVAYHHMKDMTDGSLTKFLIEMSTDAAHKDALILDLRFNNGGNIHNEVLEYLSQKAHYTWNFRDKAPNTHPNVVLGSKPIVVLINECSLSDAEVTSNGIRNLGIAKLIGTETYRWIIFTSSVSMADGSSCRIPAWGCYNLDGSDLEITGVAPDIYIKNTFMDRLAQKDPQLERAIQEILKDLKK